MQSGSNEYLENPDDSHLETLFTDHDALPYERILSWAGTNANRVENVVARDDNRRQAIWPRAILSDSRNETMAKHIASAFVQNPEANIIAYGGQMHMLGNVR
jgi:hypothetical protein